jgi:predicted DNA-binding transcriptional regulator AlpA
MMPSVEIWATLRQEADGSWRAETWEERPREATASDAEECVESLQDLVRAEANGESLTLVVHVLPVLAGVAEAAEVMGWDKRRVITYIDRGHFPRPLQALASGRVWVRSEVEDYADAWRAKQAARKRQQQR